MNATLSRKIEASWFKHEKLVRAVCHRFCFRYRANFDDALSEATWAFIEACKNYNPNKRRKGRRIKFTSWAYQKMWFSLMSMRRRNRSWSDFDVIIANHKRLTKRRENATGRTNKPANPFRFAEFHNFREKESDTSKDEKVRFARTDTDITEPEYESYASLSEHADEVIRVTLQPRIINQIRRIKKGCKIRTIIAGALADLGWSAKQICETFRELAEVF